MSRSIRISVFLVGALLPLVFGSGAELPQAKTKADTRQGDPGPSSSDARQIRIDVVIARVECKTSASQFVRCYKSKGKSPKGRTKSATTFGYAVEDSSGYLEKLVVAPW